AGVPHARARQWRSVGARAAQRARPRFDPPLKARSGTPPPWLRLVRLPGSAAEWRASVRRAGRGRVAWRTATPGASRGRVQCVESKAAEVPSRPRAIAERLGEILGEPLIGELRRLSSGASRETFAFRTRSRGSLVVQMARGGEKLVQS